MRWKLIVFLFLCANVAVLTSQNILPDSASVTYRNYSESEISEYLAQKEYNYDLNPKYEQNPIKRLWYNFVNKVLDRLGNRTISVTLQIVKFALIAFGVFVLLRFLFRSSRTRVFKRDDKSPDFYGSIVKGETGQADIGKLIAEAEKQQDYDLAVSYRFLSTLRALNQSGKIDWRDYKTNLDYSREIKDLTLSVQFRKLSDVFEYVVYGEFNIDSEKYQTIKEQFESFMALTKSVRA